MKVILLQDVAKVGNRFHQADVPDGFARNKLIPEGRALPATPENVKRYERQRALVVEKKNEQAERVARSVALLRERGLSIAATANERGHLFEALSAERVAEAATAEGAPLFPSEILMEKPIKHVGEYTLRAKAGDELGFTLHVVAAEK